MKKDALTWLHQEERRRVHLIPFILNVQIMAKRLDLGREGVKSFVFKVGTFRSGKWP